MYERIVMKKDLVSIIVPVYNAERFLAETINTVISQTYENWELILINDCSKDGSYNIFKEFNDKRIRWYDQKQNGGPALARNKGIDIAKGRFICFIDADDKWDNDKLEKQISFMKEKKCAFSYTSYVFSDENCVPTNKRVIAKETLSYRECLKKNIISTITVMFDVDMIDKELIKMPDLKFVEDTATWWKILRHGYVAYGISNIYSYYRRLPNTNSSNKFRTQIPLWNLYRKEEKMSIFSTIYYMTIKNINAILRRI